MLRRPFSFQERSVPPRLRSAVATVGVVGFLTVYVWGVVTLADHVPDVFLLKLIYFAVAGTAWGLPLLPLLSWAGRGPKR